MARRTFIPDLPRAGRRTSRASEPSDGPFGGPRSRFAQPPILEALPQARPQPPAEPAEPVPEASPPIQPAAADERPPVPTWIRQVWEVALDEVAGGLGLSIDEDRLSPCPNCDCDEGGKVRTTSKGRTLWSCRTCGLSGRGSLDMASYHLAGESAGNLEPDRKALLHQWFADQGWCDAPDPT